jgi:hypothetical protein
VCWYRGGVATVYAFRRVCASSCSCPHHPETSEGRSRILPPTNAQYRYTLTRMCTYADIHTHTKSHAHVAFHTLACSYSSVPGGMNPYGNPSAPLESNNGIFLQAYTLYQLNCTLELIRTRTHSNINTHRHGYLHDVIGDFGGEHSGEMVRHPNNRQRTRVRHLRSIPIAHKHRNMQNLTIASQVHEVS